MASPNTSVTELIVTTLDFLGEEIVDGVTNNNAATAWLKANDGWGTIEGGSQISEPLAYAENGTGMWYGGGERLNVGHNEEFTEAQFAWKQLAVAIVNTGLETDVQNVGSKRRFDLVKERIKNARRTMANLVATGFFSAGTSYGGKQLTGLQAAIPKTNTAGTYGGINRATSGNEFWQPQFTDVGALSTARTAAQLQSDLNSMWYKLVRGADKPKLIIAGAVDTGAYEATLQTNQRFTDPKMAELGFENLKYKSAVWVMDGNCTASTVYFLNTDYLHVRVAENRNFKALPKRVSVDQDAEVVLLAAALNLTCSNQELQGGIEFAA